MALDLNIDKLLAPIPGPNPSGEDLRYTQVYDQIVEAKREDDQLNRGEWQTELKRSDWLLVAKLCYAALIKKSKDLQIAVWFTESLLHQKGFSGLAFGLELTTKLLMDFWDRLYPEIEDGDLDYRVGPLTYLNDKANIAVFQVPLCDPANSKGYDYYAWQEARNIGGKKTAGPTPGSNDKKQNVVTAEDFNLAVNKSPIGYYKDLREQLIQCSDNLKILDKVVTQRFEENPPGFALLQGSVMECLRVVENIYNDKKKSEVIEGDDADDDSAVDQNFGDGGLGGNDNGNAVDGIISKQNAIYDISLDEKRMWRTVSGKAGNGDLKSALDQLMAAAALAPSERQKNRYLLLVAKICINAGRYDLAQPIVEELYGLIESLNLEKWEHPAWISEVIEALYRCLSNKSDKPTERAIKLFQKLCTMNITKAAAYRINK